MTKPLSDEISNLIITKFHSLSQKGKPTTKSNGVKEWTVMAGIASLIQDDPEITPSIDIISITTGVKSLPDEIVKSKSQGRLLHDCHAEILALRALNRFVVSECHKVGDPAGSAYIEEDLDLINSFKFKLKSGIKFVLYVSELPCGDCSLSLVHDDTQEDWSRKTSSEKDIQLPNGVLRGREYYKIKGKVRTKPGRRDSPLTLSKSCCDKLALTQVKSLLNGMSSKFINPDGFKLSLLIVPESSIVTLQQLEESFHGRLKRAPSFEPFSIATTSNHHISERTDPNQSPSNRSLVYVPSNNLHESIVNSLKEGYFNKKTYLRKGGESSLSRVKLLEQSRPFLELSSELSYLDLKNTNVFYKKVKEEAYNELDSWCQTGEDDFDIV